MKLLFTLLSVVLAASSLYGANVYVSMGSFNSPYYEFYSDPEGSIPLTDLDVSQSYTFYRLNNAPIHPFYISDVGYAQDHTSKITITGDGSATSGITGTQNFTLSFNDFDPASDTLYFFCTAHQAMLNQFTFNATLPLIATSDLFGNTTHPTWTRFISTALAADGVSSQATQTLQINVTNMPIGSQYRVAKTVRNGNWYFANGQDLVLGLNTITVPSVDFDRTVKIQFEGGIEFDNLTVNGAVLYGEGGYAFTAPAGSVLASSEFSTGSSAYPYVYTSALTADGASSQEEQTFILNVTELPEGGTNYSIYKTTANGSDYTGNPVALTIGQNIFSVPAVSFDRSVKLRISADVAIDQFVVNGNYIVGTAPLNAPVGSVLASSEFSAGSSAYPYVYEMALEDDGVSSQEAQTMVLNVTALPENGAKYSVFKTVANGQENAGAQVELVTGENIITASAVDFNRIVKFRLTEDIAIDRLSVNGTYLVGSAPAGPPTGSVYPGNDFALSSNGSWPYIYTATNASEGASSQSSYQFLIVVTELPEAGANYTINKTTANGNWYTSDPIALNLGVNRFTVPAVDFDRTIKFRLSSTSVAYEYFGVNQLDVYSTTLDSDSDGVDDWSDYAPNDPDVQVAPPEVAPALSINTDGTNVTLEWSDSTGFQVHSSDDLILWTSTGDSESPYTESIGTAKFYKLAND
jgi:hypothetical protein